jgi:hypothetical protein
LISSPERTKKIEGENNMDRFTEDFPTYSKIDRDEDGRAELPEPEQFACDGCGLDYPMTALGAEVEPECTCVQTDVDYFESRYCEAHGSRHRTSILLCKACAAPEPEEVIVTDQDTADTLTLLAKAGCSRAEAAVWMSIIEERIA